MDEGCGFGSEADISGGAALSHCAAFEAGSDGESGAACDPFSDDKNSPAVPAVADDVASAVGNKE